MYLEERRWPAVTAFECCPDPAGTADAAIHFAVCAASP